MTCTVLYLVEICSDEGSKESQRCCCGQMPQAPHPEGDMHTLLRAEKEFSNPAKQEAKQLREGTLVWVLLSKI